MGKILKKLRERRYEEGKTAGFIMGLSGMWVDSPILFSGEWDRGFKEGLKEGCKVRMGTMRRVGPTIELPPPTYENLLRE